MISTFAIFTLFLFDPTVTLWISTCYFTVMYQQFSMLIKLWLLTIYMLYGLFSLVLQLFGCGLVFFLLNKSKCFSCYNTLNKYAKITPRVEYIKKVVTQLCVRIDTNYKVSSNITKLNTTLGRVYTLIYRLINNVSPYAASRIKLWFDNLTSMIIVEDSLIVAPEPKPAMLSIDNLLTQIRNMRSGENVKEVDEIDKLIKEISQLSSSILSS